MQDLKIYDNYSTRPGIDRYLLLYVEHGESEEGEVYNLWLNVSGLIISGDIVKKSEAVTLLLKQFVSDVSDTLPESRIDESEERTPEQLSRMERVITLCNVNMFTPGNAKRLPFARVKLSQVGAWGPGRIELPGPC